MLVSGIDQSDSVNIYVYLLFLRFFFLNMYEMIFII